MADSVRVFSQGIDYLGFLNSKLRDLRGYSTLANEFLQNADDAGATGVVFDFREDALLIENNSEFSCCDDVELPECPWRSTMGRRCDFHRIRLVAGADKRNQDEVIGAFGVGFVSAYQITDQPEIVSAGRRWTIRPDRREDERITEQDAECVVGTIFRLPWAIKNDTPLRRALGLEPVTIQAIARFQDELERALPSAILFLPHISAVEIRLNGQLHKRVERLKEGNQLVVQEDGRTELWHLIIGSFEEKAADLREHARNNIEMKRKADVSIAIPDSETEARGLLCAYLPTAHKSGLPFHINADFFTFSDRKRVLLDSNDYQQEWNEAAIRAAAVAFRDNFILLRDALGHVRIWKILQTIEAIAREATNGRIEQIFATFWEELKPGLREQEIVRSSSGAWKKSIDVFMLRSADEEDALPILEAVGLGITHPELRFAYNLLVDSNIGVRILTLSDLAKALTRSGFYAEVPLESAPSWVVDPANRLKLDKEIRKLLDHLKGQAGRQMAEDAIAECAIALGRDRVLWPCNEVYAGDDKSIAYLGSLGLPIHFLASADEVGPTIRQLCPEFCAEDAVNWLAAVPDGGFYVAREEGRFEPLSMLEWFEERRNEILASERVKKRLADLPIFPAGSQLLPLSDLVLPGGFSDPLGIAAIVDVDELGGRREFLRDLGAAELTFSQYAARYIPEAFADLQLRDAEKRQVVSMLAEKLGEVRDNDQIRTRLENLALIECRDGRFRQPKDVYFSHQSIERVLGEGVPITVLPPGHAETIRSLYEWLGVSHRPRQAAIVKRVTEICADAPRNDVLPKIQAIFEYLADYLRQTDVHPADLEPLRSMMWLPARGNHERWYRPKELFATFQEHLFESQALFLEVPRDLQNRSSQFLIFLGVRAAPEVYQVVRHLLQCAEAGIPVNRDVYRSLNDHAQDSAILQLRGKACLLLPNNVYVKPDQVLWGEHPFGRFRYRLGPDVRRFEELLSRLEVRELPTYEDAEALLFEISDDFGKDNAPLDDEAYAVVLTCWQMLSEALENGKVTSNRLKQFESMKVIPDKRHMLCQPGWICFEDRAGLAAKFGGFLQNNVIARPQGGWLAMAAAGVRNLRGAISFQLVECDDPMDDEVISARLQQRRPDLLRVVESLGADSDVNMNLSVLDALQCQSVRELKIQYSLNFSQFNPPPVVESVPAHYQEELTTLFFVRGLTRQPWAPMACELALALCPDSEPGRLASGIKEVLAAETDDEARLVLDDLGFAPLQQLPCPPDEPGSVEGFGGTADFTTGDAITTAGSQGSSEISAGSAPTTASEALKAILGNESGSPTPMPTSGLDTSFTDGNGSTYGRTSRTGSFGRPNGRVQHQGKLRTYVSYKSEAIENGGVDSDTATRRSEVEQAGVIRVVEDEKREGRLPEVKPPMHPGYDIESRDTEGKVKRYIEVKSLSGPWGSMGVGLSKPEFEKARELADRYWLYVVERAQAEEFQIYRIQNPALKANQFFYDNGWAGLSEKNEGIR